MSAPLPTYVESAMALRRSLEEAAEALHRADLDRLLACETAIQSALTHLSSSQLTDDTRHRLAQEIQGARAALSRCRRLGVALDDFVRSVLDTSGASDSYGREGTTAASPRHTMQRTA